MTTISQLQTRAYEQAKAKGFHDYTPESERESRALAAEKIALMHSELSEALEEMRSGWEPTQTYYSSGGKPEGVPTELADTVIRILDFAGAYGIDLEAAILEKLDFNAKRGRMHGGRKF